MKEIGIVRRMDEFGKIAIPKEIRRALKLEDNAPLVIFVADNNTIILKKYISNE